MPLNVVIQRLQRNFYMLVVMSMLEVRSSKENMIFQISCCFFHLLDKLGWTPLMKACYFCNPDIILTLLQAGADIHAQTEQGRTALHELW